MRLIFGLLLMLVHLALPGRADAVDDLFATHVAAGTYEEGAEQILGLSGAEPSRAAAAAGALQFAAAIEHLGQALYRHGLAAPQPRGLMMLPVLRYPVPANPSPQPLVYQGMREIFQRLVSDLDRAEASLARLGDAPVRLPVDPMALRLDFDADGKTGARETLGALLAGLMGGPGPQPAAGSLKVSFDTADIYWMRGYGRFISSFAQFFLAHDFHESFDKTFHLFFPGAGLTTGDRLARNRSAMPYSEDEIGDLLAFVHLMNWPVVEPQRLSDVRLRLVAMTEMSRQSWAAARRETDDDHEWLPNSKQKSALFGEPLADAVIDGWLTVMAEFSDVLEGRKLLPHWRFDRGMNLRRLFEESRRFDLVLLATGTDAVNYLEDGPVSDSATWSNIMGAFEGNFLGYALWFN